MFSCENTLKSIPNMVYREESIIHMKYGDEIHSKYGEEYQNGEESITNMKYRDEIHSKYGEESIPNMEMKSILNLEKNAKLKGMFLLKKIILFGENKYANLY